MADDRFSIGFERSTQELLKETWELLWCLVGTIAMLVLVGYGIYFSGVALIAIIGSSDEMRAFAYAIAVSVSALEVSAIKIFGNEARAAIIKLNSSKEYKIVGTGTIVLFIFDVATNWAGLFLVAFVMNQGKSLSWGAVFILLMAGLVMAFSEVGVGWMLRATGTSYAGWVQAKKKYDGYTRSLKQSSSIPHDKVTKEYDSEPKSPLMAKLPKQTREVGESWFIPPAGDDFITRQQQANIQRAKNERPQHTYRSEHRSNIIIPKDD